MNMVSGKLWDGTLQPFYFLEGHELAGHFKGMAIILKEHGYANAHQLRTQCKDFNCPKATEPQAQLCCCWRILYNEPNFASVMSLVEQECIQQNFQVLFLPKFHCELNFIEQCWGCAKWVYRDFPPTKSEKEMEEYVMQALGSVNVELMWWWAFYFEHVHIWQLRTHPVSLIRCFVSWMPITVDSQDPRPLGQATDTRGTTNYLIQFLTSWIRSGLGLTH